MEQYNAVLDLANIVEDGTPTPEQLTDLANYARCAARAIGTIKNAIAQDWSHSDIIQGVEFGLAFVSEV